MAVLIASTVTCARKATTSFAHAVICLRLASDTPAAARNPCAPHPAAPNNALIQALSETGVIGLTLLLTCYYFTLCYALQTLSLAKRAGEQVTVQVCAPAIFFMVYAILVANKRGVLTAPDTFVWTALAMAICDRAQASLRLAASESA